MDKILEYKRFKQAAAELAEQEADRMLQVKRGNIAKELAEIGEATSEGSEVQTLTLFKLTQNFRKGDAARERTQQQTAARCVQIRLHHGRLREYMMDLARTEKTMAFEKIFDHCKDRVHAIFLFLGMLELVQAKYLSIMVGEGRNNFIIDYVDPSERPEDAPVVFED